MADPLFSPPDDEPPPGSMDWSVVPDLELMNDPQEVNGTAKLAQSLLNAAGANPVLVIDGNFGTLTQTATAAFQLLAGLPSTGVIERDTWSALALAAPFALLEHGPRDPGMVGPPVGVLQELLTMAGAPAPQSGEFDPDTVSALDTFANSLGLNSNGTVDPAMWAAIVGAAAEPTPTGSGVFTFVYDSDFVANGQPVLSFLGRIDNEDPGPTSEPLDAVAPSNDFRVEWQDANGTTIYRRRLANPILETAERLEPAGTGQRTVITDPHPNGAFAIRLPVPPAASTLAFFGTFAQGPQPTGATLVSIFAIGGLAATAPFPAAPPFPLQTFHGDLSDRRRRWTLVILAEGYTAAEIGQFTSDDGPDLAVRVLASPLFDDVRDTINIVGIPAISNQSGSGLQPPFSAPIDTFFRAQFNRTAAGETNERFLFGEAQRVVDLLSNYDALKTKDIAVAVIVNSGIYGGMATSLGGITTPLPTPFAEIAWFSKNDPVGKQWLNVALHELGHAAFGLLDEYEEDDPVPSYTAPPGNPDLGPNVTFMSTRAQLEAFSKDAARNRASPLIRIWRVMIDPNAPTPSTAPNPAAHRFTPSDAPIVQPGVDPDTVGLFEGAVHRSVGIFRAQATCRMRDHSDAFCPICQAQIGSVLDRFSAPRLETTGVLTTRQSLSQFQGFSFSGDECALMYSSFNGSYEIQRVDDIRAAIAPILPAPLSDTPAIEAAFSWLVPFDDSGTPAFLGFEFATGRHAVHHVTTSADGVHVHLEKVFEFTPAGVGAVTHVALFVLNLDTHVVLYNRFTGELRIDRIDSGTQVFTNVFSGSIQPGWTTVTTVHTPGGVFLLTYELMTGSFKVQHLETLGATFTPFVVGDPVWSSGFTHIQPYEINNRTYFLRHNGIRGRTSIVRVRADGSGADPRFEFDLPPGAPSLFGAGMPSHVVATLPSTANHPGTVLLATSGLRGELRIYTM